MLKLLFKSLPYIIFACGTVGGFISFYRAMKKAQKEENDPNIPHSTNISHKEQFDRVYSVCKYCMGDELIPFDDVINIIAANLENKKLTHKNISLAFHCGLGQLSSELDDDFCDSCVDIYFEWYVENKQ